VAETALIAIGGNSLIRAGEKGTIAEQLANARRTSRAIAQISRLEQNQRLPDLTALKALFIPALHLEHEPALTTHLLALADASAA
jgi:hypothetical protein